MSVVDEVHKSACVGLLVFSVLWNNVVSSGIMKTNLNVREGECPSIKFQLKDSLVLVLKCILSLAMLTSLPPLGSNEGK